MPIKLIPILHLIERFSGLAAVFITWFFVVFPAVKFGINNKSETFSTTMVKSNLTKPKITFGLAIGGVFESLFLLYIIRRFSLDFFSLGVLLCFSTSIVTIVVSFFNPREHPKMHTFLATYYFFLCPTSLLLIGISARMNNPYILMVSIVTFVLYAVGEIYLILKYKTQNALMEFWAFSILSIWALVVTFL